MPMSFSQVTNDWYQQWESVRFVCFENVKEIIVFEEAHGSISDLQVETGNALNKSLENFRNVWLKFLNFTSF